MVSKLTMQKTIYKNLKKRVEFDDNLHIFQLKNFQTKIKLLKIEIYKQN